MPIKYPQAHVTEDYSLPLTQADGTAVVIAGLYLNGQPVRAAGGAPVQRVLHLSADEMNMIANVRPADGSTVGETIGKMVLTILNSRGDLPGRFPEDYVQTNDVPPPQVEQPASGTDQAVDQQTQGSAPGPAADSSSGG